MNILLYGNDEQRADYFRRQMDKSAYGTENYKQARQILSFLCNKIRQKDRVEAEANANI